MRGYATLARRLRGVVIDMFVVMGVFLTFAGLSELVEPGLIGVIVAFSIILLYEPLLVGFTGGTLGHRAMKMRVWREQADEPIGLLRSLLRSITKAALGVLSFFFMALTRRHQALHDKVGGSVVVVTGVEDVEYLRERADSPGADVRVSALRRVMVIAGYALTFFIAVSAGMTYVLSSDCIYGEICSPRDDAFSIAVGLALLLGWGALIVLGWLGRLPGARPQR